MKLTLRQALLGGAFLIVYGVVVFVATRGYYMERATTVARPTPTVPAASGSSRPFAMPQQRPPVALSGDPQTLADQADDLFTQKRFGEAIVAYRKLLELIPDDADTLNDLGLSLFYAGRTAEALAALEQGVAQEPGFQRIWLTLGFVRLQAGRTDEARAAFQACLDLDPESPIAKEARRLLGTLP
jgi:tetratricopeptide (TPR) repeat protein